MARPKLGVGVTHRLQVLVPEEEIPAIDDWGFANRIGNRSATVRRLCAVGLEADTLRAENERLVALIRHFEAEARRYAKGYAYGSDGRNTFVIFADMIAERAALSEAAS